MANPGELWEWQSEQRPAYYIVDVAERTSRGQMYVGLNVATSRLDRCFMTYDAFNGWVRVG